MRILFILTYYRPHISGLTVYVQRLAEALAARGHRVTVLTSQYRRELPREEILNGVRVVRAPVALRVSKGVIMPTFPALAAELMRGHDVVNVQLPQFEAGLLTLIGRFIARRPVNVTYHCDLQLPPGILNRFIGRLAEVGNHVAGLLADRIITYTQDYAEYSTFLRRFLHKTEIVYPPVPDRVAASADVKRWKREFNLGDRRVVGMASRFAAEKGVEHLLDAVPRITRDVPDLQVLFVGQYEDVIGEGKYFDRLKPAIDALGERWRFLGVLPPEEMVNYYSLLDCLVVPSVNSTESFGLVQVEAMLSGTPVVASDLPGVRVPVQVTGMGEVAPVGDVDALAQAIVRVVTDRQAYVRDRDSIASVFDIRQTVDAYESIFVSQLARSRNAQGNHASLLRRISDSLEST